MPRHRKHIKNPYLTYDQAKEYVRELTPPITTRAQYLAWHKEHKPSYLPRWPHHVWDGFSWNDFLGTTNSFEKTMARVAQRAHKKYRNYWDAVRYAQAQAKHYDLTTRDDWMQFWEEYDLPDDIPKRPWQEYSDFSIDVWLGNDAVAHLKTAVEGNVAIVALHHVDGEPDNVVELRVWKDGYHAMIVGLRDESGIGRPYKVYEWDDDGMRRAIVALEHHGHKRDRGYIVPNLNALIWSLMDCLAIYQKG